MLNLTPVPITIMPESGEAHRIEPSGYVARVEYERVCASVHVVRHEPYVGEWGHTDAALDEIDEIPIIEEIPKDIHIAPIAEFVDADECLAFVDRLHGGDDLLLVSCEVAEAAVRVKHTCDEDEMCCPENCKPHPLAAHMVWGDDKSREVLRMNERGMFEYSYRELRRVPRES